MKILKLYADNPNERYLDMAVDALRDGKIIIYPTDTLYALGCDALNNQAIERICKLKSIKSDKTNLSIICKDISQVAEYARFSNDDFKMMKENLPGAFTFIYPSLSSLPKAFKGRKTVGIRIPDNRIATMLVERLGNPIMTSSVEHCDEDYGCEPELMAQRYEDAVEIVIDAGRGELEPSTVVDCTSGEAEIIRQGKGELQ
ncbi:MAG: threonylcarbamoyl-AMP synthase [Muribaculaceae bacterium]|nr:threonylcarbamoyl-AMP synthase [Muribaculaceae bacterium]MEE1297330.1 L-threonylcarbamoyladenylate synthase [Muribaculaceae bacterium]